MKFSQSMDINASGVVGAGHPPIIHSWTIPGGFTATAGQVLINTAGTVALWDGSDPVSVVEDTAAGTVTATSSVLAIAASDILTGDETVTVLVHGCYLFTRATVGSSQLTLAQCMTLIGAGLFAENDW